MVVSLLDSNLALAVSNLTFPRFIHQRAARMTRGGKGSRGKFDQSLGGRVIGERFEMTMLGISSSVNGRGGADEERCKGREYTLRGCQTEELPRPTAGFGSARITNLAPSTMAPREQSRRDWEETAWLGDESSGGYWVRPWFKNRRLRRRVEFAPVDLKCCTARVRVDGSAGDLACLECLDGKATTHL